MELDHDDEAKYPDEQDNDADADSQYVHCSEDEIDLNEPVTEDTSQILIRTLYNPADGHCFFRAMSQFLTQCEHVDVRARADALGLYPVTVASMRGLVFRLFLIPHPWCDDVLRLWRAMGSAQDTDIREYPHAQVVQDTNRDVADWSPDERRKMYERAMQPDVWGDETCIAVMSTLLNVRVLVHVENQWVQPWYEYVQEPNVTVVLQLTHNHYELCVGDAPDGTTLHYFSETDLPEHARLVANPNRTRPTGVPSDLWDHALRTNILASVS